MLKQSSVILLLLIIAGWLLWRGQAPTHYQLQVVNNSLKVVDQVRLFGEAVVQAASVQAIEPGASRLVSVELRSDGGLRFEVTQGLNRIDTYIEQDVGQLTDLQQRLEINPNNRFIIDNARSAAN